jgi:hypothetical protein
MLRRSIRVIQPLDAITGRSWTMGFKACGEQYERWIDVGETATDFVSYLIALVSTGVEDSCEPIYPEDEAPPPAGFSPRDCVQAPVHGGNSRPPSHGHVGVMWPLVGLWYLPTRRLDETMQMASSDMQHWRRRLVHSWFAALTAGNLPAIPSNSCSTNEQ